MSEARSGHSPHLLDGRLRRMLVGASLWRVSVPLARGIPSEFLVTSSRANRRGIFALMGAMAAFAVNDMILKLTAQRYPLGEVITVRGLIATVLVGSLLIGFGQVYALRATFNRLVLSRTALDGAAMV